MSIAEPPTRTIEVTRHCKERWVQRICDENVPEKSLSSMIYRNDTKLTLDILAAYGKSTHLWQGVLYPGAQSAAFSIGDDNVIFVTNTDKTSIMTVYRIELPFPDAIQNAVIKSAVTTIRALKDKVRKHNNRWVPWYQKRQAEQARIDARIRELEAEYEAKIATLKSQRAKITTELATKRNVTDELHKQIEEHARIICSSISFKQEWDKGMLK